MKIINKSEAGYSIVEMIISCSIFLIVIAAVFQVMKLGLIQRNTINTRSDATKNARVAMNYLRRDIINAGLGYNSVGGNVPDNYSKVLLDAQPDAGSEQDVLTALVAGNNVRNNILSPGTKTDAIAIVTRDLEFNDGNSIAFTGTETSSNAVVIKTSAADSAKCRQFDLLLFSTGTTQVVGIVTKVESGKLYLDTNPDDPIDINIKAVGTIPNKSVLTAPGTKGTFKKLKMVSYSINAEGTLVRTTYGNRTGKPAAEQKYVQEIIYGVKDMQIRYLTETGTVTDDPTKDAPMDDISTVNQQRMNNVIQVEITLTVLQDNESSLQSNEPLIIKENVSTRNLQYPAGN